MAEEHSKATHNLFEANRLAGLATTAHLIAAIFNSAGKTLETPINPQDIYRQLNGEDAEPEMDDEVFDDGGSLTQLKLERAKREAARRGE